MRRRLGKDRLSVFDVFSGSGIVSRYFKQYASFIAANDLEKYAAVISECYLTNKSEFDKKEFDLIYSDITGRLERLPLRRGLIARLYAPENDEDIRAGERVFYTARNAAYLDTARMYIDEVPAKYRPYLLAPLLSEASVHANTSGVFKGFYKDSDTGIGRFGGRKSDALSRIRGDIVLPYPVFSNYECEYVVKNGDAVCVCGQVPEVDVAYLDPPYNEHPYGSNYFMLNLLVDYREPDAVSPVSGIPPGWNRSEYNKKQRIKQALSGLREKIQASYLLVSFSYDGFIPSSEMSDMLKKFGRLEIAETAYNTFRGSRNLTGRDIYVKEYLYLLEKN